MFLGGRHPDPGYAARREGAFIVAVNCGQAGRTCFCVSMDAGPRATSGFDLALTELVADREFLVEVGTECGAEIIGELGCPPSSAQQAAAAVRRFSARHLRLANAACLVPSSFRQRS